MSTASRSLKMTGLFEAELLVELMLRHWGHPECENQEFRQDLLERAADALHASVRGVQLLTEVPPGAMNLVAALWYVEASQLGADQEIMLEASAERARWLDDVRRALPSCFCDPNDLAS